MSGFNGMNEFNDPFRPTRRIYDQKRRPPRISTCNVIGIDKITAAVMIETRTPAGAPIRKKIIVCYN